MPGQLSSGMFSLKVVPTDISETHSERLIILSGSRITGFFVADCIGVASPTPEPTSSPEDTLFSGRIVDMPGDGCPNSFLPSEASTVLLSGLATPT